MSHRRMTLLHGDAVHEVEFDRSSDEIIVTVEGSTHRYRFHSEPGGHFSFRPIFEGLASGDSEVARSQRHVGAAVRSDDEIWVHFLGRTYRFEASARGTRSRTGGALHADEVVAPMTGTVRTVSVQIGQNVSQGDPVIVLEAMKMEHVLRAPRDGVVLEVSATEGSQAGAQDVLVRLEP